ncbi:BQ2448_7491 [Microbotryum intermedium]|uniref:BQ2448_7491 protein n=1 Tax=Microbotryum intermedium TaxID=269621 RepID=A0A238FK90_9BASI|nr:BQ2448_7491 [Microbotryum intermedium]
MSNISVPATKTLLKDHFGNIDASNWSSGKELLEMALSTDDHLLAPLKTQIDPPAMPGRGAFTSEGKMDEPGWFSHEAFVAGTLMLDMAVCGVMAHEKWAKLESVFAAASSPVDRSSRIIDLITMPRLSPVTTLRYG